MSRDPRATARACFALAARAGTEGEKAAALNRGMAIVERYKLDPNEFAIPGRIAGKRAERFVIDDPHAEAGPTALREFIIAQTLQRMFMAGYFANTMTPRRETATQKAEREREERMSAYLKGRSMGGYQ